MQKCGNFVLKVNSAPTNRTTSSNKQRLCPHPRRHKVTQRSANQNTQRVTRQTYIMHPARPIFLLLLLCALTCTVGCSANSNETIDTETIDGGESGGTQDTNSILPACLPMIPPATNPMIDDFEDNDLLITDLDGRMGQWYSYRDTSVPGSISMSITTDGVEGSDFALNITGDSGPTAGWGPGFGVGIRSIGDLSCPYDLSSYKGFSFWSKGTVNTQDVHGMFSVSLAQNNVMPAEEGGGCVSDCYDFHAVGILLTPNWTYHEVFWQDLFQAGWGGGHPFDPSLINQLVFTFATGQSFDVSIDTIKLIQSSEDAEPDIDVDPAIPVIPSAGCLLDPSSLTTGHFQSQVLSNTVSRSYTMTVPDSVGTTPLPLVIVLHGAGATAADAREHFGHHLEEATGDLAIITYGEALAPEHRWHSADPNSESYLYFDDLLAKIKKNYCVDENRIFVTGFSNGAVMTNGLRCERGDVIRAVAPVAGAWALLPSCDKTTATLIGHSPSDSIMTFDLGLGTLAEALEKNGCDDAYTITGPGTCVAYNNCDETHPVHFCINDMNHYYPRWQTFATWQFFKAF